MNSIKFILGTLIRIIIAIILIWLVIWMLKMYFPNFNIKKILYFGSKSTSEDEGWLPAPRNIKDLLNFKTVKAPDSNTNVFNGYENSYKNNIGGSDVVFVTYTPEGTQIIDSRYSKNNIIAQPVQQNQNNVQMTDISFLIRNLSIYQGGHIYTGISFTGEAKSTMFQNGRFPIIIVDNSGKVVNISNAEATSDWSTAGWTRFQIKINAVLPNKIPCTMIFQSATQSKTIQPVSAAIPILCN